MKTLSHCLLSILLISFASHVYSVDLSSTKHRFLAADSSKKRIAIVDENGKTEWEMKIGPLHDLHCLDNGNILLQTSWTRVAEVEPATGRVVWEYDATQQSSNAGKKLEIHAFQRLSNGNTMVAESGTCRILELDSQAKIVHEVPLKVSQPHPHRDTRLVRKLESGNYLVCHEGDGVVREYSPQGATAWEFPVPLFDKTPAAGHGVEAFGNQCFSALRLANGNTLIATGNGHRVIEVSPAKEVVWQLTSDDLPGIELAWVTTLQQLPSGNIVIGNCHAGEKNPQIIEVNREKKIVWQFLDFDRFGNSLTNTQILTTDGSRIVAKLGQDR
jgi:outer membrane protein assembly factor BamB